LGRIENRFYILASGITFRAATAVRSLSQQMSLEIGKVYGRQVQDKTVIVPNRVDMSVFSPPKSTYGLGGAIRIIAVGSYVPVKNHLALIRDVFAAQPKALLTIVGGGPLGGEYRKLAESIGCSERLTLVKAASHREVAALLADSDIFVHYSLTEGVPRALLEAMAMGLPTVISNVGYVGDFANHGENTLILGCDGASTLEEAIGRLAGSSALRNAIGVAAHGTIRKGYEWSAVFDSYRNVVASLGDKSQWR
jgi:glycosyltransferase involved in cell wall biosynthesis